MSEAYNGVVVRTHLEFGRPMVGLPDVVAVLNAVDELWVGCFDLANLAAGLPMPQHVRRMVEIEEGNGPFRIVRAFPIVPGPKRDDVPRLERVRLSLQSPLVLDLAGLPIWEAVVSTGTMGLLRYVLRSPEEVASWLPRTVASWRENWARAERAKTDRLRAADEHAQYQNQREVEALAEDASSRVTRASIVIANADLNRVDVEGPGAGWAPPS